MVFKKRYRKYRKRFKRARPFRIGNIPYRGMVHKYMRSEVATKLRIRAYDITSSAAGVLSTFYNARNPSGSNDWAPLLALYDQYRVNAIKLKWYPYQVNSVTVKFMPIYVAYDTDVNNVNPISSLATALDYANVKAFNVYLPFTYYVKPGKVISTGGTNVILAGGWIDTSNATTIGCVGVYGEEFTADTKYGHFIVTYYCEFKNRR